MATFKLDETKSLFKRVYNNKMVEADEASGKIGDEAEIKAICQKVFGDGSSLPDPTLLHAFNELVIQQAEEVAKPMVSNLLSMLANTRSATRGNVVQIDTPRKIKAKVIWSANGSGVDLIRVEGKKSIVATPQTFTAGFYYEPLDLVTNSVETFRTLIQDLAEAKVRLYMKEIAKIIDAAVTSTKIPTNNVINGANTTITAFNQAVGRASRFGGRPMLIADPVMINDLAMKIPADANLSKIISDGYKDDLLLALNVTQIGRATAMNLVNPFIDEANTKVELNHQVGYMIAGEGNKKPMVVVEYGGMRQKQQATFEDDRVMLVIAQDASINLLYSQNLFYIKDTALTI
jgi:hypothetical protein